MGHSISSFNQCYRIKYSNHQWRSWRERRRKSIECLWYCCYCQALTPGFSWSDQIYFKAHCSFFKHADWKPQSDARRHAELPFGSRRPSGQQLYKRWHHLCCIDDAKWHPYDHGCPRSWGSWRWSLCTLCGYFFSDELRGTDLCFFHCR